ncbi:MAG: hypothetical protein Q4C81_10330 [Kocuria sp.]|nr:hypothetical protein [Kocuria sp.]
MKSIGDLDELRAIHRYLFQDVYDWAGDATHRQTDLRRSWWRRLDHSRRAQTPTGLRMFSARLRDT